MADDTGTDWLTLADDIDQWADADEANARNYSFVSTASTLSERAPDLRTAARLLREQAATADRLAAAERDRDEAQMERSDAEREADDLRARLAALTDAIGDPDDLRRTARFLDTYQSTRYAAMLLSSSIAAAAAVTAPNPKEPTDG